MTIFFVLLAWQRSQSLPCWRRKDRAVKRSRRRPLPTRAPCLFRWQRLMSQTFVLLPQFVAIEWMTSMTS